MTYCGWYHQRDTQQIFFKERVVVVALFTDHLLCGYSRLHHQTNIITNSMFSMYEIISILETWQRDDDDDDSGDDGQGNMQTASILFSLSLSLSPTSEWPTIIPLLLPVSRVILLSARRIQDERTNERTNERTRNSPIVRIKHYENEIYGPLEM